MDPVTSLQCAWAAVHFLGLASALAVRIFHGGAVETPLKGLYLCSLAGVGAAALAGRQFGWPLWTISATTLGVMILVAVADGGRVAERA